MVEHDREDLAAGRIRWTDLTPQDWRDRTNATTERQKTGGRFEPFEMEYTRKDGGRLLLLVGGATFEQGGDQGIAFLVDLTDQKRAEEKVRESELKLRQIIETVPGIIWSNGPDGEPTHINRGMLEYSGLQFEDFRHRGWRAFVHPADFPEIDEAFYHAIRSGAPYQGVMRLRRADGGFRWHHARCEPLCDQQGRIIQWYGLAVDIDETKKAEERLRRSEAYLAEAERLSHSGSAAYSQTEILYMSEEAHRMYGFDPLQGIPSREAVWQRMHPDDLDRTNEIIERAVREKRSFGNEFRILRPDGTIIHIEAINHPVFSESGEFIEIVATGLDVTDRKRAEEALRESELKLRKIVETVPSMLWSTNPDGEPTRVNQRILDYAGMRFEDFLSLGWKEFLHPEDFPETARAFYRAIQTGEPYEAVHRLRRTDGQYRWHHARAEPLRDKEQRIIQWYGLSVDIDERKKAEDRLRRSEAYLSEAERLRHTGGWAVSRKGERTIVYWSEESYRIFGFDPLQGMPTRDQIWQQIHPDDRSRLREEADAALREKRDYVAAFRILLPDETIKYLESNAHHMFSASGELLEIMGTFVDVTERKRADDALRKSEAQPRRGAARAAADDRYYPDSGSELFGRRQARLCQCRLEKIHWPFRGGRTRDGMVHRSASRRHCGGWQNVA